MAAIIDKKALIEMIENMTFENFQIWQETDHIDTSSREGKSVLHQHEFEVKIQIHGHLNKL